jgi:NAD(P)-dependent dehydrogenase (short-subunit alcohol dehydrogenase family)
MSAARPWALVTGAGRRIGRALAFAAADLGYGVAVHVHRSVEAGEAVVGALAARGLPARLLTADLADPEAPRTLIRTLAAAGQPPSLLVNNAARFDHDRLASADASAFDRQMAVNVRAPMLLIQAFAAALPEEAPGLVVNLLDQRIARPDPNYLSYGLTKAALWAMTQNLALELAPRIRVNALAPGLALADAAMDPARAERIVAGFPLRRGGSVDDLVRAFRYLVGATAVTGTMLAVDGGAHLGRKPPDA